MNESTGVKTLKEECLRLFQFRDNFEEYENNVIKIAGKVHDLKLDRMIDPGHLRFFLVQPVEGKKLSDLSRDEFSESIEEYFGVKEIDYYFQIIEIKDFPDSYRLGHGTLFTFTSLPQEVRIAAESLSKGEVPNVAASIQRVWEQIVQKLVIPVNPNVGHWLKISISAISSTISLNRAFEYAEDSLDVLRLAISTAKFHLPQHAVALDIDKKVALPVAKGVEFSKYSYNPRHQELIDTMNDICVRGASDLEKRIKNAIHFYRIADNNSPDHQKIFFYVAAVENLVIGDDDRDVIRWKFGQKGALLLSGDPKERLELVRELRELYDERSHIAHGGKSEYDFFLTISSRDHLRAIILKMMNLTDKCNIKTVAKNEEKLGQSLDEYLDNIIYS
jgi:hypothetical protein